MDVKNGDSFTATGMRTSDLTSSTMPISWDSTCTEGTDRSVTTWYMFSSIASAPASSMIDAYFSHAALVLPFSDPITGIPTDFFSRRMCSAYSSGLSGYDEGAGKCVWMSAKSWSATLTPATRPSCS
jgi:hypothetical protein